MVANKTRKIVFIFFLVIILLTTFLFYSFYQKTNSSTKQSFSQKKFFPSNKKYFTENVIIVVIDGPRYSETWGNKSKKYIPHLNSIFSNQGCVNESFYNAGHTLTIPGHTAITTGIHQKINNSGKELPNNPSIFQYWLKQYKQVKEKAWIITSKDKLQVLTNCKSIEWKNKYTPAHNCGINGINTGYRDDSITLRKVLNVLSKHQPSLMLINFREPDYSGHAANWKNYLKGIQTTDKYTKTIIEFVKNTSFYKNKTTIFITNDHGRHLNDIKDGFVSHGDNCEGCRHINLFAYGPDFKKEIMAYARNQTDLTATIAELLHINNMKIEGEVMKELFK